MPVIQNPMNNRSVEVRVAPLNDGIAGRTRDSTPENMTVYIDPLVPSAMWPTLVVHECCELIRLMRGDKWETAHQGANRTEKRWVERCGAKWEAYNRNYLKLLRKAEARGDSIKDPADIFRGEAGEIVPIYRETEKGVDVADITTMAGQANRGTVAPMDRTTNIKPELSKGMPLEASVVPVDETSTLEGTNIPTDEKDALKKAFTEEVIKALSEEMAWIKKTMEDAGITNLEIINAILAKMIRDELGRCHDDRGHLMRCPGATDDSDYEGPRSSSSYGEHEAPEEREIGDNPRARNWPPKTDDAKDPKTGKPYEPAPKDAETEYSIKEYTPGQMKNPRAIPGYNRNMKYCDDPEGAGLGSYPDLKEVSEPRRELIPYVGKEVDIQFRIQAYSRHPQTGEPLMLIDHIKIAGTDFEVKHLWIANPTQMQLGLQSDVKAAERRLIATGKSKDMRWSIPIADGDVIQRATGRVAEYEKGHKKDYVIGGMFNIATMSGQKAAKLPPQRPVNPNLKPERIPRTTDQRPLVPAAGEETSTGPAFPTENIKRPKDVKIHPASSKMSSNDAYNKADSANVEGYFKSISTPVNRILNSDTPTEKYPPHIKNNISALDSVIDKAELADYTTLYRAMTAEEAKAIFKGKHPEDFLNKRVLDKGYTTAYPKAASASGKTKAGDMIMVITAPKGTKAAEATKTTPKGSDSYNNNGFILHRNIAYRVEAVQESNGITIVRCFVSNPTKKSLGDVFKEYLAKCYIDGVTPTSQEILDYIMNTMVDKGVTAPDKNGRCHDDHTGALASCGGGQEKHPPAANKPVIGPSGQIYYPPQAPAPDDSKEPAMEDGKVEYDADEKTSLRHYVGQDYIAMNSSLRSGNVKRYLTERMQTMIEIIDGAIDKSPVLKEETPVFRGIHPSVLGKNPKEMIGKVLEDRAFMSASTSLRVAQGFGDAVMYIKAPKGAKALAPDKAINNATTQREHELLFPRGTKLVITNVVINKKGFLGIGKDIVIECNMIPPTEKPVIKEV